VASLNCFPVDSRVLFKGLNYREDVTPHTGTTMNYYQFNIGDYKSHTEHLTELEDLAFRRMLDFCYLHEKHLPESIEEIGRLIRMRTHSDCIANVLREFFILEKSGYINKRIKSELITFQSKSKKAKESAKIRWDKNKNKDNDLPQKEDDAKAMRTHSEGNAKQETRNKKQETIIKDKKTLLKKPDLLELQNQFLEKGLNPTDAHKEANKFYNHYETIGWVVGKAKHPMKNWKTAVSGWITRSKEYEVSKRNESGEINFSSTGWSEGIELPNR